MTSRRITRLPAALAAVLALAIAVAAVAAACGSTDSVTVEPSPTITPSVVASVVPGTITDAARSGDLRAFLSAVTAAGLQKTLQQAGPFTVFAPNDEALGAITLDDLKRDDKLSDVLAYHIVPGQNIVLADVSSGDSFMTEEGQSVTVTFDGGATLVNDATVTAAYAGADWTLYVIDRVLFPPVED
jgi:uncharacterized surface protein with fasciclin (FAS1) repeats